MVHNLPIMMISYLYDSAVASGIGAAAEIGTIGGNPALFCYGRRR
jgi:hypothetical protein